MEGQDFKMRVWRRETHRPPRAVGSAGDQRVDEQLMTVAGGDVQRGVAVLVHAVDFPAWSGRNPREVRGPERLTTIKNIATRTASKKYL